ANSKVVFTNYNYSLNNVIPSVILNLNKTDYEFSPLKDVDAFSIINENRNNVMYNLTLLNVLETIHTTLFELPLINKIQFNGDSETFPENNFLKLSDENISDFEVQIQSSKYDMEQSIFFPILFLGKRGVQFDDCYITSVNERPDLKIYRN